MNGDDFDGLLGGDHIKFVDVENNKLVIKDMWLDHKKVKLIWENMD